MSRRKRNNTCQSFKDCFSSLNLQQEDGSKLTALAVHPVFLQTFVSTSKMGLVSSHIFSCFPLSLFFFLLNVQSAQGSLIAAYSACASPVSLCLFRLVTILPTMYSAQQYNVSGCYTYYFQFSRFCFTLLIKHILFNLFIFLPFSQVY